MSPNFELLTLQFGKYKDCDINEIYITDPNYCKWLFTYPTIRLYPNIYKFLKSKFKNEESGEIYLDFGKYKGKSLSYICQKKDIKYICNLHNMPLVRYHEDYKRLYTVLTKFLNEINLDVDMYY